MESYRRGRQQLLSATTAVDGRVAGVSLANGDLYSLFISMSSDTQRALKSALVVQKYALGAATIVDERKVLNERAQGTRTLETENALNGIMIAFGLRWVARGQQERVRGRQPELCPLPRHLPGGQEAPADQKLNHRRLGGPGL